MPPAGQSPEDDGQHAALDVAFRHAHLTLDELWTRYFALGGDLDLVDVEAYLVGLLPLPSRDRDVLAHVVNERLDELTGARRVPYSRAIRLPRPAEGPLAALVGLLEGGHFASAETLTALVAAAARAMGVGMAVHLVDHEQRRLHELVPGQIPASGDGPAASVDGSLAGRAFQTVRTLSSDTGGEPRLWVPLLDGSERLGVLEVRPQSAGDLHDPALREQCGWVASLVAHLLAGLSRHGDDLERSRRSQPRTPSAELVWQQLPPLTAATRDFVLAGLVEPGYSVGGDVFDFALSDRTVSLAMFDAMGHGLGAGLLATAALAAYRSTRRAGRRIDDQVRGIDAVVETHFPGSSFLTGVLAELDVRSGRLRYVNAGHPAPLLLRGGKVVKELAGGRRLPLGLGAAAPTVAEETLQPGDWLVLYTDGITEARDAAGAWFGERRLEEFLVRAAAAGQPPPETVRRLVRSVLDHQAGRLQDDASVLLACWGRGPAGQGGPACLPSG
jgi:hypothetical protein